MKFVGSFLVLSSLFGSLYSSVALAQDLNFQEYRKFLMNGSQNGTQGAGIKMAIQTTCTTATGQTYRVGEKAYDQCLKAAKSEKGTAAPETTTATSTTIHIGN